MLLIHALFKILQTYQTQTQTPERNIGIVSGSKDDTAAITGGMSMMNPFDNSPRFVNNTLQPASEEMKAGNLVSDFPLKKFSI